MTKDQRAVAIGAVTGVLFMLGMLWLLRRQLPIPDAPTTADRLAYTLKWDALPTAFLFLMIGAVGNGRFFSEAIDPTLGRESQRLIVNGRVADNTTQQLLLFVVGSLGVAANLRTDQLPLIGAAAITFTIMRAAFWIGYRIMPAYRAFGFAGTNFLNLILLATALWLSLR